MAAHLVENADDSDVLVSTLMNHVQLQGVPTVLVAHHLRVSWMGQKCCVQGHEQWKRFHEHKIP